MDVACFWYRRRDGTLVDVDVTGRGLELNGKWVVFNSARDITGRKQAEEKLYLAASVFTHARECILITTPDGTIIDVNDTFSRITGYRREEILGRNPRILGSGRQSKEFYAAMWRELTGAGKPAVAGDWAFGRSGRWISGVIDGHESGYRVRPCDKP